MGDFPKWMPDGCPQDSEEIECTLYRGCKDNPPSDEDLTPHALSSKPRKQKLAEGMGCIGFALSVWVTEADATHAQKLFPKLGAKWHIFAAKVSKTDGQLAATPSRSQPGHHSYWPYENVDLKGRLSLAIPPLVNS
ncbi:hypothetical protein [Altererythrobacter aquiaggeris]|uniref:hypothetical protein n=1 Tax=Aestuarierythrobacter aquiaggeris TaxID=1898396 RepID=UPI003016738D